VAHVRCGPGTAGVTKGEPEAREADESRAAWMEDDAGGGGGGAARWW
jgi:hypothetical protein